MSEEKKTDWQFDFRSKDSVADFTGSVVRAGNVCKFLVDHLPLQCDSATQFSVSQFLVIAEHCLNATCNMLVNYQKVLFDVLESDQSTEAGTSE